MNENMNANMKEYMYVNMKEYMNANMHEASQKTTSKQYRMFDCDFVN